MKRKIVFLGAGSGYFEFVLAELATTPELAGCRVVMYDINRKRMDLIRQVGYGLEVHSSVGILGL